MGTAGLGSRLLPWVVRRRAMCVQCLSAWAAGPTGHVTPRWPAGLAGGGHPHLTAEAQRAEETCLGHRGDRLEPDLGLCHPSGAPALSMAQLLVARGPGLCLAGLAGAGTAWGPAASHQGLRHAHKPGLWLGTTLGWSILANTPRQVSGVIAWPGTDAGITGLAGGAPGHCTTWIWHGVSHSVPF